MQRLEEATRRGNALRDCLKKHVLKSTVSIVLVVILNKAHGWKACPQEKCVILTRVYKST
jgi:hypothetical protein